MGVIVEAQDYILANCDQDRSGCWLWKLSTNNAGYGNASWGGKRIGAHVLAHLAFKGPVPKDWQVDHRKSCPRHCVNHDHLTSVTRGMNQVLFWRRLRGQMPRRELRIARLLHHHVEQLQDA